jgi:hypothetical protein
MSGFRPNPLRLLIQETTSGCAEYLMARVVGLFGTDTVRDLTSENDWSCFTADPARTIAYVPQWSDWPNERFRFEINGNRFTRILQRKQGDRVIEIPQTVEAPVVCVASDYPRGRFGDRGDTTRWLTMRLPAPPSTVAVSSAKFDHHEVAHWTEVQRLIKLRVKLPVLLPEWADIVIEYGCRAERWASHVPAFVEAWKTMTLLRSFQSDDDSRHELIADFESLAASGLLLRGAFRERRMFPSLEKVSSELFRNGEKRSIISPLTGKGVVYEKRDERKPQEEYASLF